MAGKNRGGSRVPEPEWVMGYYFELYDSRFVHDSPESELDIYIRLV